MKPPQSKTEERDSPSWALLICFTVRFLLGPPRFLLGSGSGLLGESLLTGPGWQSTWERPDFSSKPSKQQTAEQTSPEGTVRPGNSLQPWGRRASQLPGDWPSPSQEPCLPCSLGCWLVHQPSRASVHRIPLTRACSCPSYSDASADAHNDHCPATGQGPVSKPE